VKPGKKKYLTSGSAGAVKATDGSRTPSFGAQVVEVDPHGGGDRCAMAVDEDLRDAAGKGLEYDGAGVTAGKRLSQRRTSIPCTHWIDKRRVPLRAEQR
jgi:hypothetical protein